MSGRLVRCSLLDPRTSGEAAGRPILDSVCIPADEIADRPHELPAQSEVIRVVDVGEASRRAQLAIESLGRDCALVADWSFGASATRGRLWEPNEFLAEVASSLTPGRALDIGCGSGRDCVWLAAAGWDVLGIDRLADAIQRAVELAATYLEEPEMQRTRFEARDAAEIVHVREFDLASMIFCFDRSWVRSAIDALVPGGSLVIEAFTPEHQECHGRPSGASRIVTAIELTDLASGCEIRHVDESARANGRHTARLWAFKS